MNNEPLTPEVKKAIDGYLSLLNTLKIPPPFDSTIGTIRKRYEATEHLLPTQIGILQRCFLWARNDIPYEVDWLPVGHLDFAIAEELDGSPCKMLSGSEIEEAIRCLPIKDDGTEELGAWHSSIAEQLILTGWLPSDQLGKLKRLHLESRHVVASRASLGSGAAAQ